MFEQLFHHAATVTRHATAPFAEERIHYLNYCWQRGDSRWSILRKADDVLWIARKLEVHTDLHVTVEQVRALVANHSDRDGTDGPQLHLLSTRKRLIANACAWLRFLGYLREPVEQIPFGSRLDEYANWAKHERGLSEATIDRFRRTIRQFLHWYGPNGRPLSSLHANDIDAYLAFGSGRGWTRVTIRNVADALKAFLRYGAQQGWCEARLPQAIQGPRIYALERLPTGPRWEDVQRLFAGMDESRPTDVRDRAILMLFAIYALRESEVATLRLDDIDWEHDQLRVPRAKRGKAQVYPLLPSVGNALIQYLQAVRRCDTLHREVFLTLVSPYHPLSRSGLYDMVYARLKSHNVQSDHYGPHSLRHACATRLVAEGLTLKEIGDHLGHRSTSSTRVYAKVDLPGLREVATFDLGEL
ncbi:Tyrosine recombinase XerC [Paraburkholderia nemoris]|jgi:integrase/recombinase XerD|uniref:tyrosine-type recombinase/integrase n=1 Tax=Paraburkholderia nemoris TaxID=2793076 RepID=UPI00190E0FA6|nr:MULTISPECIES: tyrosine-type recombinase/integrase [Paraburkholderia]MBK3786304.1 tyrosine-type recombinase/integrase [Paraburkholderia aspalathi]CAE6851840.1 Tyrosine recombinase XerC [Paraburkholderia nemoris]